MLRKTWPEVDIQVTIPTASMRPQRNAAENVRGKRRVAVLPDGFNEAAA